LKLSFSAQVVILGLKLQDSVSSKSAEIHPEMLSVIHHTYLYPNVFNEF